MLTFITDKSQFKSGKGWITRLEEDHTCTAYEFEITHIGHTVMLKLKTSSSTPQAKKKPAPRVWSRAASCQVDFTAYLRGLILKLEEVYGSDLHERLSVSIAQLRRFKHLEVKSVDRALAGRIEMLISELGE